MPNLIYRVKPLEHGMQSTYPSLYLPDGYGFWAQNGKIDQKSFEKRWGYSIGDATPLGTDVGRDLCQVYNTTGRITEEDVQAVILYQTKSGTRSTVYLTPKNAMKKETATSKTFSYITKTKDYNATIASISGTTVTGKAGTTFQTDGIAAGDIFILDTDDLTADQEVDTNWGTISSMISETVFELTSNYTGTTGSWGGSEKNAIIRRVYSVPAGERWTWAIVKDVLYFANGGDYVQAWNGAGYADDLDTTYADRAKYCIEYANRLILAELYLSGSADPLAINYSKEGDPTDWTDTTAGTYYFYDTEDFITGLGKIGANLVVYKRENIIIGNRTSIATDPITFPTTIKGTGMIAPYSLVQIRGANAFLGRDNFYYLEAGYPIPIEGIREKFFDLVGDAERELVWGFLNHIQHEIVWVANTSEGKLGFCFDYDSKEWTIHSWGDDIVGAGKGAV